MPKSTNPLLALLSRDPDLLAAYVKQSVDVATGNTLDWRSNDNDRDNRCPFGVPLQYQVNNGKAPPKHFQHASPAEKFPELYRCARAGNIPDSVLVFSARRQLERAPIIQVQISDDELVHFLGQVRGDTKYASDARRKIERYCGNLADVEGSGIFFTLTIDPKLCPDSLIATNLLFYAELKKFKRRIKEYATAVYVSVVEAQGNGRLHAHVLVKFTGQYYRHWVDEHGRWRLDDDNLWHRLQDMWPMGSTDIQVIQNDKIKGYLTKYVSKGFAIRDLTDYEKSGKLSFDDRKNLLNMLMPIIVHNRMFDATRSLTAKSSGGEKEKAERLLEAAQSFVENAFSEIEEYGGLVKPLNKVTSLCRGRAYLLSYPLAKDEFKHLVGSIGPPNSQDAIDFRAKSICLGCQGCIFSVVSSASDLQVLRSTPKAQVKG